MARLTIDQYKPACRGAKTGTTRRTRIISEHRPPREAHPPPADPHHVPRSYLPRSCERRVTDFLTDRCFSVSCPSLSVKRLWHKQFAPLFSLVFFFYIFFLKSTGRLIAPPRQYHAVRRLRPKGAHRGDTAAAAATSVASGEERDERQSWSETPMSRQRCIPPPKRSVSAAKLQLFFLLLRFKRALITPRNYALQEAYLPLERDKVVQCTLKDVRLLLFLLKALLRLY